MHIWTIKNICDEGLHFWVKTRKYIKILLFNKVTILQYTNLHLEYQYHQTKRDFESFQPQLHGS